MNLTNTSGSIAMKMRIYKINGKSLKTVSTVEKILRYGKKVSKKE